MLAIAVAALLTACSNGSVHHAAAAANPVSTADPAAIRPAVAGPAKSSAEAPGNPVPAKPNPSVHEGETALPRGSTGSRDQIPWDLVSVGWQLAQPGGYQQPSRSLYLYDPAGGRYLISEQVPAGSVLRAWSPDGQRALFESASQELQLDLHTGTIASSFARSNQMFVSYTRPRGLALVLLDLSTGRETRVAPDGQLQLKYPTPALAVDGFGTAMLYTRDGSAFVNHTGSQVELTSNAGRVLRTFTPPAGFPEDCEPTGWWSDTTFVENCRSQDWRYGAFLQAIDGSAPTGLITESGPTGLGYTPMLRLSNADALFENNRGCGASAGYSIRRPDGSMHPLPLPAGVPAPGNIVAASGDQVVFKVSTNRGCGDQTKPIVKLISYNLVSGQTSVLLDQDAIVFGYPSR